MVRRRFAAGLDVGGTKCAVLLGELEGEGIRVVGKRRFATAEFPDPLRCLGRMCELLDELLIERNVRKQNVIGVGISCGGPLDSASGTVFSPPNLPGWDAVPAVSFVEQRTGLRARLENDANACALAEWKFGAGRGTENMVFLTFGTGLGAGIIANGRLLSGHSGMAGECGHIRLARSGPVGYGKAGSFEGFCSGEGIAQLGCAYAEKALKKGKPPVWCPEKKDLPKVTAKLLGDAAEHGDGDACAVYRESGRRLGEGLSILIDLLNPECIVIGSIFARSESLLRPEMERRIAAEALPSSARVCRIVPAALGESVGDIASLSIAVEAFADPRSGEKTPTDKP